MTEKSDGSHPNDEEPTQPQPDELSRRALEALQRGLTSLANDALCNSHLPAPDALGILADEQIRSSHFAKIQNIALQYPGIAAIYVRASYEDHNVHRPYVMFEIRLAPFSKAQQRAHWPAADQIETALGKRFICFFLPAAECQEYCAHVLLYRRQEQPIGDLATGDGAV